MLKKCPPITFMRCLRYSQFLFEIARGNGHETEFANGVEGVVRIVAVRENRYVAEHLVSSLYAQDRNFLNLKRVHESKSLLILRCSKTGL
jgi:hypothetical protein